DLVAGSRANGRALVELRRRVLAIVLTLLVDVTARGERASSGAGDDDAADLVVGARARDGVVQLAHQLMVHRVELLGTIHGQDRDALHFLDQDVVRHVFLRPVASERRAVKHSAACHLAAGRRTVPPCSRRPPRPFATTRSSWTSACTRRSTPTRASSPTRWTGSSSAGGCSSATRARSPCRATSSRGRSVPSR